MFSGVIGFLASLFRSQPNAPTDDVDEESMNKPSSLGDLIETITRPDKLERVHIFRRHDGLFIYDFEKFEITDLPEYDFYEAYWYSVGGSGLHADPEGARREAAVGNDWVREQPSIPFTNC